MEPPALPNTGPTLDPSFVPKAAPPYPVGALAKAQEESSGLLDLDSLHAGTERQRCCWTLYLTLRKWWFDGMKPLTTGDNPEEHHQALRHLEQGFKAMKINGKTPLGLIADTPQMAETLEFLEDSHDPRREAVARLAYQTAKTHNYPLPDLVKDPTQWPTIRALDEMEMVCVEWLAKQASSYRNVFKQSEALRNISPNLARREAVILINTWRAIMTQAMKRHKDEVRAESELQMLESASEPDAAPAAKLAATRGLASLHGLGKEERSQDAMQTMLDLLSAPLEKKALPPEDAED